MQFGRRKIWVDGDACPKNVKEILFRAAERVRIELFLVANQFVPVPKSPLLRSIQVPFGIDVADNYIVEHVLPGDLVVTADIPLAALVVGKNAVALNPRGTLYNEENIGTHLARRNFMDELRSTGAVTGGPDAFGKVDQQTFANALDRWLAKRE